MVVIDPRRRNADHPREAIVPVSVEQARRFAPGYIEVPTEEELVEKVGSPVESCGSGATRSRDRGFGPGAG